VPKVYSFLATLPPRSGVAFLPLPSAEGAGAAWGKQFEYMRYASLHQLWMVNGITGVSTPSYQEATTHFSRTRAPWVDNGPQKRASSS